ncbi:hypothetical protein ABB37_07730 [Leptomonas pyrrhocoris]|uniref:Uncharacterized protein n=1 Tax=Leptomonas pyrrhocoris TaxID=157538 RepID=A0A0N0DSP7_LEPPY|nr:hypothetical protein ABB37_07730 [Leptomonas pyrrhocoris]XP_015654830.1 hypothetical protein ABB37_07730 [Leptomonas pyrrhocoris]XP_015654831.1 hypothetical protein ABB37_07730 [Leptomonas pyrrhocoris]KPA76390.1 hypothetical protein ABB37_07730 [Leptomonas pyrrhocoris]KPA76391.1 hypothetical protein ABB37_07730 [Leptomonas pyrrhocoris]KPA76392.1 hypothetical protein ABB37_07730 [Leptomonas pyrrhocoris]|eukprot:XP_015654829.1 hypothetical protein ABB37_07730 [Leptomonas pyrrhocoris]
MVELNSMAGKALVGIASGSPAPATDGAREAASLFLFDVTQSLRWHAVAAGVALAATPLVYQLSRIVAQRYRAELVSAAKDAVQREELFNGAEADGVLIDPADEGGITISYNTLSSARRQRRRADGDEGGVAASAAQDGDGSSSGGSSGESATSRATAASSALAMRVGRRHSWAVSSFARQVLAVQRVPTVQFVRTCSRAAACQYCVVVLRVCMTSCVLCVASLSVTLACCTMLDKVIPMVRSSTTTSGLSAAMPIAEEGGMCLRSMARSFFCAPLFHSALPPSPSVGCSYGLYDFSVSVSGVWSRLLPKLDVVQALYRRVFGRLQPLHAEWRDADLFSRVPDAAAAAATTTAHARADAVWAALTPRGYFVVTLLPRLPWRVLGGLQWVSGKVSNAVLRRWCGAVTTAAQPPPAPPKSSPPPRNRSASRNTLSSSSQRQQQPPKHKKLIHAPLAQAVTLVTSDVVFAGIVFAATLFVSNDSGGPRALVHNAAGARYNVFCWVEAVSSLLNLAVL